MTAAPAAAIAGIYEYPDRVIGDRSVPQIKAELHAAHALRDIRAGRAREDHEELAIPLFSTEAEV